MTITKQDIERTIALTDKAAEKASEAARELERQAAELRAKLGLVRGTRRDVRPRTPTPPRGTPKPTVEAVLRHRVATAAEIATEVGLPVGVISAELAAAKKRGRVVDLGVGWSWVVGDEGPTAELNDLVVRLVSARPMTFPELIAATGAREKRVSGAIVRIQRDDKLSRRFENQGTGSRARWYLRPGR